MDDRRFDDLTRLLGAGTSRRALVKRALAGLVGGMTALTATRAIGVAASQPNGAACARATDCASRICKDGVCCNGACTGQCEACNLPGLAGTCSPVAGNPVGGRPACPGTGPCKATCDGVSRSACTAFPGGAVSCGASTCADGWQTTYGCGGNGTCHPTTTSCGLFLCNPAGTACLASCASDADCVGKAFCAGGVCQGDQPLGAPCTSPDQCQHGFCIDGVCCLEACTDQCEACDVAGHAGFCTPTPGGACDDGDPCTVGDACDSAGDCEGTPADCSAVADQCNDGVCRPTDGVCIKQPKANGTGCNDGNACTQNDVCQNGACAGTPVVCTTPGVCETAPGTCNPQTGSAATPMPRTIRAAARIESAAAGPAAPAGRRASTTPARMLLAWNCKRSATRRTISAARTSRPPAISRTAPVLLALSAAATTGLAPRRVTAATTHAWTAVAAPRPGRPAAALPSVAGN